MHRVEYLLWLKHMGIASQGKIMEAIEYFSSPEEIYNADTEALTECGMFNQKEIAYLEKKDVSFVTEEIERCNRERCYLVDYYSRFYPEALRSVPEPPLILYVKGSREVLNSSGAVTIAGSRSSDAYGISVAQSLAGAFALNGEVIVSGMAHGVDSAAALGAVNSGGKAIGVLCCGMDVDYPKGSAAMREKIIASGGAVITEFEMGTAAQSGYFHIRNRIMAGLSQLTVIVQAGEKSGALITAKKAKEYSRRLAAVPNPIDSVASLGVNALIADGAEMIYDIDGYVSRYADDKTKSLAEAEKEKQEAKNRAAEEETRRKEEKAKKSSGKKAVSAGNTESDNMMELISLLKDGPLSQSELAEKSGRSIKWINSTLIILEVSGKVKLLPDGRYGL